MDSGLRIMVRRALLAVPLLLVSGMASAQAGAIDPGADSSGPAVERHGYPLGAGFNLGGYSAAEVADYLGDDPAMTLRSLSLLLSWQGQGRWSFFSEVEGENLFTINADQLGMRYDGDSDHDLDIGLERFYVDYAWSDALQFRIGKFLTPIGRWNVIHAAPLTWTTSRPLITESTFPTNATGAMVHGVLPIGERTLEWALYASPGEELAPEHDSNPFKEAYGLRLDFDVGYGLQLGASAVEFEQTHDAGEHKTLYGVDFLWQYLDYELSGEWAYRVRTRGDDSADERGAYIQAVAPIVGSLFGVARYESFNPSGSDPGLNLYIGGLAWRFHPGWVTKVEYRFATDNGVDEPEGWLGSISVLF
ncbi:hypothetical protein [Solimonas marina]|uniref:Porin n=1 Tax=Solimonas marina TaxID=2714601 RepID=A0A970B6I1_9GAMM|nr:hypothetical protein [Solimonas marina]NKF22823.1 hypothetical protein [Solimonas marina]